MSTQTIPIYTDPTQAYRHSRIETIERLLAGNIAQAAEPKPEPIPSKMRYESATVKYPATPADIADWGIARQAEYFAVKSNRYISVKLDGETKERKVVNPLYLAWLDSQTVTVKTPDVVINPGNVQPVRVPAYKEKELPIEPINAGTPCEVSERFIVNTGRFHSQVSEPIAEVTEDSETGKHTVKVLTAPKGQRGLLAPQKPGESFEAFQARQAQGRAIRAANAKAYRDKLHGKVFNAAEKAVRVGGVDPESALASVMFDREVIPERVGTGLRDEIMASLASRFPKGFSSATGKIRRPTDKWKDGRLVAAVKGSQYQAMWHSPASVPVTLVRFQRSEHGTITCIPRDGRPCKSTYVKDAPATVRHTPNWTHGAFAPTATQAERMESVELRAQQKDVSLAHTSFRAFSETYAMRVMIDRRDNPEVYASMFTGVYEPAFEADSASKHKTSADLKPARPKSCACKNYTPHSAHWSAENTYCAGISAAMVATINRTPEAVTPAATTGVSIYSLYSAPFSRIR
jgi:hypothetical protein